MDIEKSIPNTTILGSPFLEEHPVCIQIPVKRAESLVVSGSIVSGRPSKLCYIEFNPKIEDTITNLVFNIISVKDLGDHGGHIFTAVSPTQLLKTKNLTFELPLIRLIWWRVDIVGSYGEVQVIGL